MGRVDILLQILECILKQVGNILLNELFVGCAGRCLFGSVDGLRNLLGFDEVEHAR